MFEVSNHWSLCFLCLLEVQERKKGKKSKSRPLRIDLILQHDSFVPPPKEWVFLIYPDNCPLTPILPWPLAGDGLARFSQLAHGTVSSDEPILALTVFPWECEDNHGTQGAVVWTASWELRAMCCFPSTGLYLLVMKWKQTGRGLPELVQ